MKKTLCMVVLFLVYSSLNSSAEEKLSANNYPDWFEQNVAQILLLGQKDQALKPFSLVIPGKETEDKSTKKKSKGKKDKEPKNAILLQMEGGRVARIIGDFDTSMDLFSGAIDKFKQHETGAVVSVSKTAKKGASVVAGEGVTDYSEKPFEKVMVYTQQALNYMSKNNLDSAMVEVRNANAEQKNALEKYSKELQDVEKEGKGKVNYDEIIQTKYAGLDELAGKVKNSFQNAYSFYVCGIISEAYALRGGGSGMDLNDAYISYKDALEINPDNEFIQKDVIRLAKILNMKDDLNSLLQRFPQHKSFVESISPTTEKGHLIVIYNDGLIPRLHQIDIPIPTPDGVLTLSFPTYLSEDKKDPVPLNISLGDGVVTGESEVICDLTALSAKSLKERLPGMIVREFLRTVAMGVAQHQVSKKGGLLGGLGSAVITLVDKEISKADLRGYYSLPYYVHCYRTEVTPGSYTVSLEAGSASGTVNLEIKPKSISIIEVTRLDGTIYTNVITL